jgi:proteic killer suppression protein
LEIVFNNKKIEALYTKGSSPKYRLEPGIVQSFFEVVAILEAAKDINDLRQSPSLHFEKLQGSKNRFSARLNVKWRLEMEIEWQNDEMTVGIIGIEEISNHYGG